MCTIVAVSCLLLGVQHNISSVEIFDKLPLDPLPSKISSTWKRPGR